ncbi:uncharacterized protein [Apostichopus japonicus]|uniref:uncharacterized protein n=1 Tax=Stichopus japonicus TaxID=307972 RepID=UPI003AB7CA65
MFSKKFRKKVRGKASPLKGTGSLSSSLPRTIYLMNIDELRRTAVGLLPKDKGIPPTEEKAKDDISSAAMATETDTVLASRSNGNDKEMEKRNVKDEDVASEKKDGSLHSPCDGNSLDELFFQNAVRKPPPKTNRKRRGDLLDAWSIDSLEMDDCTLFSSELSPSMKKTQNRRLGDVDQVSSSSLLRESFVSPLSGETSRDAKHETSMTTKASQKKTEPDMSFLDDIF